VAEWLDVRGVIQLDCSTDVVLRRIENDTGGDRANRVDDDRDRIDTKLDIYARRTQPLVEYFRQRGVQVLTITVTSDLTAQQMWEQCATGLRVAKEG
jgi:adenylate kinase family enzyme